jgi:transposase-like protein
MAHYNILGINIELRKELLGIYIYKSEEDNLRLQIHTDLNNRGLKDINKI